MSVLRKLAKGQSMAELAFALPALALLLLVVTDFARVFYTSITVADAARAGVAYGAQSYLTAVNYSAIEQAALNDGKNVSGLTATATHFCQCNDTTVDCASVSPCSEPNVFVQVTATDTFHTMFDYPGIPSTIPLSSTAVMQVKP